MADTTQINIRMPAVAIDRMNELAATLGLSRSELIRRALGYADTVERARLLGLYVGATRDRESLEQVFTTPF